MNIYGEVIGINVAIFTPSGGFVGVGFAIPINKAKEVLSEIIKRGTITRGWLGVKVQEITPELAKAFGVSTQGGVIVSDVLSGSPAQKGGLKRGDVITRFNRLPVRGPADLQQMVSRTKPGTKVTVEVIRNRKEYRMEIKLGQVPTEKESGIYQKDKEAEVKSLGLVVQAHEEGVMVITVEQGSLAQNAGIVEGDIILEINQRTIKNIQDFKAAVRTIGRSILFLIRRGDATLYIAVNME